MKDVAERAGVSSMTVSAVITGSSSVRVSEATRARVLSMAREMGYAPNAIARSLRRRRTNIIGLYSGTGYLNVRSPFFAEIVGGLQEGCERHRKDLLLHGVFDGRSAGDVYRELVDGRIDGLVVNMLAQDPLAVRLIASHLPVIAVIDAMEGIPSVVVNDASGSQMLVEHLTHSGHRSVHYVCTNRRLKSVVRRRAAFLDSASTHDLIVTESGVAGMSDQGDVVLSEWLALPTDKRPTAVACWNDLTAYNLLAHCQLNGVRVPEDLAIVGFDGISYPAMSARHLTTIRAPWVDVARTAVDLMVSMLQGEKLAAETVLPVELVLGDTA